MDFNDETVVDMLERERRYYSVLHYLCFHLDFIFLACTCNNTILL
jgi:hypothetical protein